MQKLSRRREIPRSIAGITRFNEEQKPLLEIKPEYIIWFCFLIALIEIILNAFL